MRDRFNLIFASAVALTMLCGTLMGTIALFAPTLRPPAIASFFDTLKYGFTVGMLSIFGLLGPRSKKSTSKRA